MNNDAFAVALAEIEEGRLDKGTWARAFAESGGEDSKAKALYIQARVRAKIDSHDWPDTQPADDETQTRINSKISDGQSELGLPQFGKLLSKCWGRNERKAPRPEHYAWTHNNATLHVYEHYLVLSHGSGKPSVSNIATAFGLIGGIASLAGGLIDKVSNQVTSQSHALLESEFAVHRLLWCDKKNAELWQVEQKRFLGMKTPSLTAVHIPFQSTMGILECVFYMERFQENSLWASPYEILSKHKKIVAADLSEVDARRVFGSLPTSLPDDLLSR